MAQLVIKTNSKSVSALFADKPTFAHYYQGMFYISTKEAIYSYNKTTNTYSLVHARTGSYYSDTQFWYDGKCYIIRGNGSGRTTLYLEMYDVSTDTVTTSSTSMSNKYVGSPTWWYDDGYIYCCYQAGYWNNVQITNVGYVAKIAPATGTFYSTSTPNYGTSLVYDQQITPSKIAFMGSYITEIQAGVPGRRYVNRKGNLQNTGEITGTTTALYSRCFHAAFDVGENTICVLGGRQYQSAQVLDAADNKIMLYNKTTGTWSVKSETLPKNTTQIYGCKDENGVFWMFYNDTVFNIEVIEYNLTFTIKDNAGESTLYTITGQTPVTRMYATYLPGAQSVSIAFTTLTTPIDATYNVNLPTGKTLVGYSRTPMSEDIEIPINAGYDVMFDDDTTLYEVYNKYNPPKDPFAINLYECTAEDKRVDKSTYLTDVGTLLGTLRDACDIVNPSVTIAMNGVPDFNYVYIPIFGRYYFVDRITNVLMGLWRIDLRCDVLMTYKQAIGGLTALIARQENDYNLELIDTRLPTENAPDVTITEIENTVLDVTTEVTSDPVYNFCLVVMEGA